MERNAIVYNGESFPIIEIELSKVTNLDSNEIVTIADYELWAAIEKDYENDKKEAVYIDSGIFYYCDSGFIASKPTESEVIEYMHKI